MRVITILCVFFSATASLAEGSHVYHNTDMHFSFILPEGWEQIPVDELSREDRKALERDFTSKTTFVCQKIDAEYLTIPCILVQIKSTEEVRETELEKLFLQNKEMTLKVLRTNIEGIQKAEGPTMLKSWKGAKQVEIDAYYDKGKHASFETARLRHKNGGDIVLVTVKLLGSHRMASLQCFADGEDAEGFLDLVDEVVDSFAYDKGYGFGEGKGIAPGLTKKLVGRGIWSWILPILGISVFIWLLRRWAQE